MERRQFRSIQQRVMKQVLIPIGFERRSIRLYVRRVGQHVQAIEFQSDWPSFYVNLAFHYEFLPTLREFHAKSDPPWTWDRFDDTLDFLFRMRLETWMNGIDHGGKWAMDGSEDEVTRSLAETARESLRVLDQVHRCWGDPAVFYRLLEPRVFRVRTFIPNQPPENYSKELVTYLISPWGTTNGSQSLVRMMWLMAERDGKDELRREYRQIERDLNQEIIDAGYLPPNTPIDPLLAGE